MTARYTTAIDRLCAGVERRRAHLGDTATLPSATIVREAIDGIFHRRTGNELRSAPPRDKRPIANVLWRIMAWHRSSGGMGSIFGMHWACGDIVKARDLDMTGLELYDELDTLAIVLLGGRSRAADNWARALGNSA
jgi:hypothetical protein